jgi:hypothetical protein
MGFNHLNLFLILAFFHLFPQAFTYSLIAQHIGKHLLQEKFFFFYIVVGLRIKESLDTRLCSFVGVYF